jgi:hypothetical protein
VGAGSLAQGGTIATLCFLVAAQLVHTGRVDAVELASLIPALLGLWAVTIIVNLLAWRARRDGSAPR